MIVCAACGDLLETHEQIRKHNEIHRAEHAWMRRQQKTKRAVRTLVMLLLPLFLIGCTVTGVDPIVVHNDLGAQISCPSCLAHTAVIKIKSNDEIVNNSAVLQNDDELFFPVGADETWFFVLHLAVRQDGGASSNGYRHAWAIPTDAVGARTADFWTGSSSVLTQPLTTVVLAANSSNLERQVAAWGRVTMSTTGGNVVFQWAQNLANASDSRILAGSALFAWKVE